MPMLSQTYIGKYCEGGQELSVFTKSIPGQDNDSYVILGESGYGKSVAAQSIVLQKANQSYSVRSIDIHNSSAPEHLFPIFRKSFEHLSSQIDAYNTPIPTTLFEPLHYADGTMESRADLSYTLSNIIANHLRLSCSSTAASRKLLNMRFPTVIIIQIFFQQFIKPLRDLARKRQEMQPLILRRFCGTIFSGINLSTILSASKTSA